MRRLFVGGDIAVHRGGQVFRVFRGGFGKPEQRIARRGDVEGRFGKPEAAVVSDDDEPFAILRNVVVGHPDNGVVDPVAEFAKLCEGMLIAAGLKKTARKNLRLLAGLQAKTNMPIMTLLTDGNPDHFSKIMNMEEKS